MSQPDCNATSGATTSGDNMGIKKRLIPFKLLPAAWGLKGKSYEIAKAEYELEGSLLEIKLAELQLAGKERDAAIFKILHKYNEITEEEYETRMAETMLEGEEREKRLLEIKHKYQRISGEEYEIALANLIEDEKARELALLDAKLKYNHITQRDHDKEVATLNDEPWVTVVSFNIDKNSPGAGSIELDWNDQFVKFLEENGYTPGPEDAIIVDQWLSDLCKNVALEAFDGVGLFNEELEARKKAIEDHKDVIFHRDLKPDSEKK